MTEERKAFLKEYRKKWRNGPGGDKERNYSREYYHKNKDKVLEYKKSVKDRDKQYQKEWYINNKEKISVSRKEYAKEYNIKNKEKKNQYSLQYMKDHPGYAMKQYYNNGYNLKKYGLTIDDYNNMFEEQEGKCAICGKHQSEIKGRLHVDHDHKTLKVRKLLCSKCNTAIGLFYEDKNIMLDAIKYLKDHDTHE